MSKFTPTVVPQCPCCSSSSSLSSSNGFESREQRIQMFETVLLPLLSRPDHFLNALTRMPQQQQQYDDVCGQITVAVIVNKPLEQIEADMQDIAMIIAYCGFDKYKPHFTALLALNPFDLKLKCIMHMHELKQSISFELYAETVLQLVHHPEEFYALSTRQLCTVLEIILSFAGQRRQIDSFVRLLSARPDRQLVSQQLFNMLRRSRSESASSTPHNPLRTPLMFDLFNMTEPGFQRLIETFVESECVQFMMDDNVFQPPF